MDIQTAIKEYNCIRKEKGLQEADKYAGNIITIPGRSIPERSELWAKFKEELNIEIKQKEKESRKAAKVARANKANIKKSIEEILSRAPFAQFTKNELKFLGDIKGKRKLTERQVNWLYDLAKRANVIISGEIEQRGSSSQNYTSRFAYSEKEADDRFDIPVYDEENKRWYDAEY